MKRPKFRPEILAEPKGPLPMSPDVATFLYALARSVDCEWRLYDDFKSFLEDVGGRIDKLNNRAHRADELEAALRTINSVQDL